MRPPRKDKHHKPNDLCTMEQAAIMVATALNETFDPDPGEGLRAALLRTLDERIASQRWYRKLWRRIRG